MSDLTSRLASLNHLAVERKRQLESIISQPRFCGYFSAIEVTQLLSLENAASEHRAMEQLLRDLIPLAQSYSRATISHFNVGAAALAGSGAIYLGANMEFNQQPLNQSIHAEQAAISNAWHHNEQTITGLAVSATPCGHCRQFINELADAGEIEIYLPAQRPMIFQQLLPHSFGPTDLQVQEHLMASIAHIIEIPSDEPLLTQAANAAKYSYSPYTNSPSGIALKTDKNIYLGRYAENCAYNPSLSPLQSALIALHLANESHCDITKAVLVETKTAKISQQGITASLLAQLSSATLEYHRV